MFYGCSQLVTACLYPTSILSVLQFYKNQLIVIMEQPVTHLLGFFLFPGFQDQAMVYSIETYWF